MLIFFALVCIASASSEYQESDEQKPSYNEYTSHQVADTFYGQPLPETGDYGVPQPKPYGNGNDGYDKNNGYEKTGECRKIKQLPVRGHRTARAKFFELKKDGKTYTIISCPNTGKPYALVASKDGADTFFTFSSEITLQDTTLLSTGFNLDFSAKCHGERVVAKSANGRDVSIKRVACVELPQPNSITGL